jgi:hypothetical protein
MRFSNQTVCVGAQQIELCAVDTIYYFFCTAVTGRYCSKGDRHVSGFDHTRLSNHKLRAEEPERWSYIPCWIADWNQHGSSRQPVLNPRAWRGCANQILPLDIDEGSIRSAEINVDSNHLQNRITILAAMRDGPILLPLATNPNAMHVLAYLPLVPCHVTRLD